MQREFQDFVSGVISFQGYEPLDLEKIVLIKNGETTNKETMFL